MDLNKTVKNFVKERDAAAVNYDVKKFRAFYAKWQEKGVYEIDLPKDDKVVEILMRKMVYHSKAFNSLQKREAEMWLIDHGCTTNL